MEELDEFPKYWTQQEHVHILISKGSEWRVNNVIEIRNNLLIESPFKMWEFYNVLGVNFILMNTLPLEISSFQHVMLIDAY